MAERPYSRYTRIRTWAALYSQHISAGYAIVPSSATNNSIDVIRYNSSEEAQRTHNQLLQHANACEFYYMHKANLTPDELISTLKETFDPAPDALINILKEKHLRSAVVLAKSSDYYHYHIDDRPDFRLVICGLHDSYLPIPTWETNSNHRFKPRETAVSITAPEFDRLRCTQYGHNILLAAYAKGDPAAISYVNKLPKRTKSRYNLEKDILQEKYYQGRPLAFLTDAKRREIGAKISASLHRYHERHRAGI